MSKLTTLIAALLLVAGTLAYFSIFVVHQTETALVVRLGDPQRVIREPGLYFKAPIADDVYFYDRRVLDLDPAAEEMTASDKKRIVADSYVRYKITDALKFFQTVATEGALRVRLGRIINASMRSVIGNYSLPALLTIERVKIMAEIQARVNEEAKQFGIEVIDVRIRRADLPQENSEAIYARMKSEREREAKEARAEGAEIGQRIRAEAERDRTVLLAEAEKRSEELRGEGDGLATSIANKAYGGEAQPFYEFYRSMLAYKESLTKGEATFVLSPNSDFFRFLTDYEGKKRTSSPRR
jgi:membrane protease subunit HflC